MARKHTELRSASLSTGERGRHHQETPRTPRGGLRRGCGPRMLPVGQATVVGKASRPSDVRQRRALPES